MRPQRAKSNLWPALLVLTAVVAILAVFALGTRGVPRSSFSSTQALDSSTVPTAASTMTPDITATTGDDATQNAYATAIANKHEVETQIEATDLSASPVPSKTPVATGTRDDVYVKAQWGQLGFIVQNGWGGYVDGNSVGVFAGAWSTDLDQGILQVVWIFPLRGFNKQYATSGRHGSVRITEEHSNRLSLVSTDGTTFYFDVPGLQFVPSLTEVVPTITPPPTYTPVLPNKPQAPTGYPMASVTAAPSLPPRSISRAER